MAVEAVMCELVSVEGFPARGEITGNFPENGLISSKLTLSPAAISML
jgi:hypothetical protein